MGWFSSDNDRGEELQKYHNQGQEDEAKGEYSQPHDPVAEFIVSITGGKEAVEQMREDNRAYDAGHENAKNQR